MEKLQEMVGGGQAQSGKDGTVSVELTLAIPLSRLFLFINKTVGLLKGRLRQRGGFSHFYGLCGEHVEFLFSFSESTACSAKDQCVFSARKVTFHQCQLDLYWLLMQQLLLHAVWHNTRLRLLISCAQQCASQVLRKQTFFTCTIFKFSTLTSSVCGKVL